MQQVVVVVPAGLRAGADFTVAYDGTEFIVTVPAGLTGGDSLEINVPSPPPASKAAAAAEQVCVTIPNGVYGGDAFLVEWRGNSFEVVVPEGLAAGDDLEIALPSSAAESSSESAAAESSSESAAADPSGETAATYTGTHLVGDTVQVYRTNGSWSPADIVDFDEVSETYTIKLLVTGQLKYLVTESEIQPLDFTAQPCGEHFVGRRVQVPFVGALSRDDVMGEVRAYDEATRTYTVRMDSGVVKHGLRSDEVRVPPERRKTVK